VTWEMIVNTMKKNSVSVTNLFINAIPEIQKYDDVCSA